MKEYTICRQGNAGAWLFADGVEVLPERAHALLGKVKCDYNYGYVGAGPSTLALALLLDALNNAEAALLSHGVFAAEFLNTAAASAEELRFTRQQILDWYKDYAIGRAR